MNRKEFLRKAGIGAVAAVSLPGVMGAGAALAEATSGQRVYVFVSFSQAPASGSVLPRIGMQGSGVFDPAAGVVKGGGTYVLFDAKTPIPNKILAFGAWAPTKFVGYTTKGLGSYGTIQPGILTALADFTGLGTGLPLALICNVGAAGLMTGQPEGWTLTGTPYGAFAPLNPIIGITHLSVPMAGASTSASAPSALVGTASGSLAGNGGGSFNYYQIASPTGAAMTLSFTYSPFDAGQAHAIGIAVYQNGSKLGGVTGQSGNEGDATNTSAVSLQVTPSASGGPVLIQVFNYSNYTASYTLAAQ